MGWGLYLQVVGTPQHYMSEWNLFELFALRSSGEQKTSSNYPHTLPLRPAIKGGRVQGREGTRMGGCKGGRVKGQVQGQEGARACALAPIYPCTQ